LRQFSPVQPTRSNTTPGERVLACVVVTLGMLLPPQARAAADADRDDIQLELSPRICTLAMNDNQCNTLVRATWRSTHEESLCLVILDHPDVKRCWEKYAGGTYSLELVFTSDLVFQLKDPGLQQVLVSEVLRVIREAIHYRHKRRQPWNIFD
jgi:hypothetical protein